MFTNQQKEPHAPRQVQHQGDRVRGGSKEVDHRPEQGDQLRSEPRYLPPSSSSSFTTAIIAMTATIQVLILRLLPLRLLPLVEIDRGAPDKGRREPPRQPDEDEGEDVVDDGGLVVSRSVWVHRSRRD